MAWKALVLHSLLAIQVHADPHMDVQKVRASLRHGPFTSAREFIDHFRITEHFTLPRSDGYSETLHAVAEAYFAKLRARLPEFLALHPSADEVRALLETPLQFPAPLHDDLPYDRGVRRSVRQAKELLKLQGPLVDHRTAVDIFAILEALADAALPQVQNIEDWLEIVTFRTMPAFEYEEFKRRIMDRHLIEAERVGDERLQWLDETFIRNSHELSFIGLSNSLSDFKMLKAIRDFVPADQRSDQTLTQKVIELLAQDYAYLHVETLIEDHLNDPFFVGFLALITGVGDPRDLGFRKAEPAWVERARRRAEKGMLRYLVARSEAGAKLIATPEQIEVLARMAENLGFLIAKLERNEFLLNEKMSHSSTGLWALCERALRRR